MSYDIDTLIKKFSYQNPIQLDQEQEFYINTNTNNIINNELYEINNLKLKNQTERGFFSHNLKENEFLNSNQIIANSTNTNNIIKKTSNNKKSNNKFNITTNIINSNAQLNENIGFTSDKEKFFNTLKSLFAIFDPECKGSIDINELDVLGASRNEILNDVLTHLRLNSNKKLNNSNKKYKSKSSHTHHHQHRSSSTNRNYNAINSDEDDSNNFVEIKNSQLCSPLVKEKIKKLKQQTNNNNNINHQYSHNEKLNPNADLVTFDEFVKAAEVVLDKRKYNKLLTQQKENLNNRDYAYMTSSNLAGSNTNLNSLYPGGSNSLNNIYKASMGFEQADHKMNQTILAPSNNKQYLAQKVEKNNKNYATLPIQTMPNGNVLSSSNSSTPTSSSLSPSSSSTNSNPPTLSQAFETSSNLKLGSHKNKPTSASSLSPPKPNDSSALFLNNANSCDLNILIEKENYLLEHGLENLDLIQQWYLNQLRENKIKQANIQKLKHQNLFSIDKMLIDLKQLNDFNSLFGEFLAQNKQKIQQIKKSVPNLDEINLNAAVASAAATANAPVPTYKDYVEQFDLNKQDAEIDKYLKDKQDRIENLQKEKSLLIRKLFEMKSETNNLSKSIVKPQNTEDKPAQQQQVSSNDQMGKVIPIVHEKSAQFKSSSKQQFNQPNANGQFNQPDQPVNTTICNFIGLPASSSSNTLKNSRLDSFDNENYTIRNNNISFQQQNAINSNNQKRFF